MNLLLQIVAFFFLLLFTLPLAALAGGALLRAGCYLSGVRMPKYWKAGLIFLVSFAFSGGVGIALVYAGSSIGSEIRSFGCCSPSAVRINVRPTFGGISCWGSTRVKISS